MVLGKKGAGEREQLMVSVTPTPRAVLFTSPELRTSGLWRLSWATVVLFYFLLFSRM